MIIYDGTYMEYGSTDVFAGAAFETSQTKTASAKRTRVQKKEIPVFFAADDNYMPFLDVALTSMKENSSKVNDYKIFVLHSGIKRKNADKIMLLAEEGFRIYFVDVADHLKEIADILQLRDYYTSAIYYRLFIVGMFPQYDKVLYMDADTVTLGDISELYNENIGNNLIGAVADGVVSATPVFCDYTKNALGVDGNKYFNSGVIVMNLKEFRAFGFYKKFSALLKQYSFRVAPDQDCLNILCKGRVHYFSEVWNRMPQAAERKEAPKLIHYNLAQKPWHYVDIPYQEYFWKYAEKSAFYEEIRAHLDNFTPEMAARDLEGGKNLLSLAEQEANSDKNFYRLYGKKGK